MSEFCELLIEHRWLSFADFIEVIVYISFIYEI